MNFNTWNMFWRLCFGFLATLISTGNILIIWIFLNLRRRKRSTFHISSDRFGRGWFTGWRTDHSSFHSGIWISFINSMACFQPCWRVHKYIVHLCTCCHFRGENVRHRLASSSYNCKLSCLYLCHFHTVDHSSNIHCFHWCKLQLHYKWQRNLPSSFVSCNTSISYVCSVLCYLEETKITNM